MTEAFSITSKQQFHTLADYLIGVTYFDEYDFTMKNFDSSSVRILFLKVMSHIERVFAIDIAGLTYIKYCFMTNLRHNLERALNE